MSWERPHENDLTNARAKRWCFGYWHHMGPHGRCDCGAYPIELTAGKADDVYLHGGANPMVVMFGVSNAEPVGVSMTACNLDRGPGGWASW